MDKKVVSNKNIIQLLGKREPAITSCSFKKQEIGKHQEQLWLRFPMLFLETNCCFLKILFSFYKGTKMTGLRSLAGIRNLKKPLIKSNGIALKILSWKAK